MGVVFYPTVPCAALLWYVILLIQSRITIRAIEDKCHVLVFFISQRRQTGKGLTDSYLKSLCSTFFVFKDLSTFLGIL